MAEKLIKVGRKDLLRSTVGFVNAANKNFKGKYVFNIIDIGAVGRICEINDYLA